MKTKRVLILATLAFVAIAMLQMLPVWGDCDSAILGGPGDATSGNIWLGWQYDRLDSGPWPDSTPYLNAPYGESLWSPVFISAAAIQYPMWLVNLVFSPVCSYNLTVLFGLVASGVSMFGFARWLTWSTDAALFAGYAYAFSPYHLYKAQGHVGYVHSQVIVLALWAGFALWKKPTWKSAAIFGAVGALAGYTDGYYLLIVPVGVVVLFVSLFVHSAIRREPRDVLLPRLVGIARAGAVAAVLLVPLLLIFVGSRSGLAAALERPRSDLTVYSARPSEFVLPARSHPVFGDVVGPWQDRQLHGSNYSEQSLFLGWSVLAFGLLGAGAVIAKPKLPAELGGLQSRKVVVSLLAVAAVGVWFSAPPTINLLGMHFPAPSGFIFDRVGFWRVYARFFLLIHAALAALAAIGVAWLARRLTKGRRIAWISALMLVLIFELAVAPPFKSWNYAEAPAEYRWLAGQKAGTVAEYPMFIPPVHDAYSYITNQVVHGKKLINSGKVAGPQQPIRQGIYGLSDPQTAPVLRRLGVGVVLYHAAHDPLALSSSVPQGFKELERFPRSKTIALSIEPGPAATVCLTAEVGWHPPELRGWSSLRWMESTGRLRVVSFEKEDYAKVSFRARSFAIPREVTVSQGKSILWTGMIGDDNESAVEFTAAVDTPISVTANPEPLTGPGSDLRLKSIAISALYVEPA